jgi:glucose-6-phosphate 1-epimerase
MFRSRRRNSQPGPARISAVTLELPPTVRLGAGRNGLSRLAISTARGSAEVYLHGAHVTAWRPAGAEPVIWVSADSQFHPDKPIRGGIPICFPWFAAHAIDASAPMHGFARLRDWTLGNVEDRDGEVHVTFELTDDERSRRSAWPHRFRATYRVAVGDRLGLALDVANTGEGPLTFEAALHTYVAVANVRDVGVAGLAGTEYLDKVEAFARKREGDAPIQFSGETDRIYLATESTVTIHDPGLRRQITVAKTGSQSTIVWNPWIDKARAMPDFGDDEWPSMLCIETANVGDAAVTLEPGSHHTMTAVISLR